MFDVRSTIIPLGPSELGVRLIFHYLLFSSPLRFLLDLRSFGMGACFLSHLHTHIRQVSPITGEAWKLRPKSGHSRNKQKTAPNHGDCDSLVSLDSLVV